jgi:4-hydroxyphenylpyruvate dioxygenase-like putative hemolysin
MARFAQNIGRVNHVVIVVHRENLESAVEEFSRLLDLEFEGPFDSTSGGLLVYIDIPAGIEVVAPYDRELATRHFDHLEKHGEGVMTVAFGVADRAAAVSRAEGLGYEVWRWANGFDINEAWRDDIAVFDEAAISPTLHGVRLKFAEVVPRADPPA